MPISSVARCVLHGKCNDDDDCVLLQSRMTVL